MIEALYMGTMEMRRLPQARSATVNPAGEAELRAMAGRFEDAESRVRTLLVEAISGDRSALLAEALDTYRDLKAEQAEEAVFAAYGAALDEALSFEEKAAGSDTVGPLAASLQRKLEDGIAEAEGRARAVFPTVTEETLEDDSHEAVTARVDEADRRLAIGGYAAGLIATLGRRATSRGTKDGAGGGNVQFSSHGTKHPACAPLEGKIFPAASAPEPPIHDKCQHLLTPVSG